MERIRTLKAARMADLNRLLKNLAGAHGEPESDLMPIYYDGEAELELQEALDILGTFLADRGAADVPDFSRQERILRSFQWGHLIPAGLRRGVATGLEAGLLPEAGEDTSFEAIVTGEDTFRMVRAAGARMAGLGSRAEM